MPSGGGADPLAGTAADLIRRNAAEYRRTGEVIRALGGTVPQPLFGVTVPDLPLSEQEGQQLERVVDYLQRSDSVAKALTAGTALTIAETADGEVAFLRAALGGVTGELLQPVRRVVNDYRDGLLDHLPRGGYFSAIWPEGGVEATVPAGTNRMPDRRFGGPGARQLNGNSPTLDGVEALAAYAYASVDSIRSALSERVNTRERRRVITALDEQLMYDFSVLDSLVRARGGEVPTEYGLDNIVATARREIGRYGSHDDPLSQQERAAELTRCIGRFDALAVTVAKQPERERAIEGLYTDEVWNNFTATVMQERIKKRLTEAYAEVLVPYFQQRVSAEELDCAEAARLDHQLRSLHERMLSLRAADTDELEDRVRNVDDPLRLLDLLGIAPLQQ